MSMQTIVHADSNPMMSRVYGNQFTSEIAQTRSAGQVGMLDTTFNGTSSYVTPAHGNYAYAVQALNDGTFITLTSDSATNSWLTKYNAQGSVVTSGFGTSGVLALSGYSTVEFMTLDPQNRLLISGNNDNTGSHYPWIQRINPNGTVDGTFTFTDGAAWTSSGQINQLAQQTTGKIIAVGFNGANAMIARYNLNGSLDTTFGASGYAILNGSNSLPTSTISLYSLVVDALNNIYITYVNSTPSVYAIRLTPAGSLDTLWGLPGGLVNISYLNNGHAMITSQLRMIIDSIGDLIVAMPVVFVNLDTSTYNAIMVSSIKSSNAAAGTFANVTMVNGVFGSGSSYDFRNMMATSNGSVYFLGSCLTTKQMMIARYTTSGVLDIAFNGNGVDFFNTVASPTVNALLYAGSIAPTGEIYAAGSQLNSGTTTPYVSRLYNTQYVTQTMQFPAPQEQGIMDLSFGATGTETYSGVTNMYNGLYASIMMQQSAAMIELRTNVLAHIGDIVVGLNGLSNNITTSSMMLAWLTSAGAIDTSVNSSGYLTLGNLSGQNEYITGMLEDGSGYIYVCGYTSTSTTPTSPGNSANTSAILRAYASSTSGTATWHASQPTVGSTYSQGVGLSIQNNRTLLCVDDGSGVGHITSYIAGTLDTSFGAGGSGTISSTSFGLHMGPCYGLAINLEDYIYAAYVDSSNSNVNVVAFEANGSQLVPTFGATSPGLTHIFSGQTVAANNVRIGFVETGDIVVAAVTATHILVAYINPDTGAVDFSTNTAISGTSSLQLTKVTGVSDGTALVTFWDSAVHAMYIARFDTSAVLDPTFNSQGSQPGVLPIQIGTNYTSRIASSALVQSTVSANQGNIVVVGYESVTSLDATPMAMRVYGDASTTEILDYPIANNTAGEFEVAYNLYPSISAGAGNVIFTYPSTNVNAGKLLVGIDNGTNSIVARVSELNMSLDTTFGSGSGMYSVAGTGISTISLDAQNNILIGGAGWAQVVNNAGTTATSFDFTTTATNIAVVNSIYQQQSGRYIVAGTAIGGQGLLVAFQDKLTLASPTAFAVDPTFNPLSFGSVPYAGCYYIGATGLYAVAINTTNNTSPLCNIDTIVVAYKNNGNSSVMLSEVTADGSGLVFGPITTGVTADNSATIRLNIDALQNIIVGGSVAASHQVKVQRYDSAGGTTTAFTGTGVVSGVQTITNLGSAGVTLTGLMATTSQQTILTGYNTAQAGTPGAHGPLFAASLALNGQLDPGWNVTPVAPDTAGVLTYSSGTTPPAITMLGSSIAIDGTILSIGATNTTASASDPIVTKVVGDTLVTQISQDPLEIAAGIIDTTIPNGSSGSWNLSGRITGIPQKIYMYNATVNSSPNGAMLVASTDSTHVYLTQLNQDLSLNSGHFGSSGVVTFNVSGVTITDLYVADSNDITNVIPYVSTQPIYLVGYSSGNVPWAAQVAYNGSSSTVISPISALTRTGSIRQSSNSRVLISGYNGSSGAIVAYNSAMTAIDTSFGNNNGTGYYTTGTATGVYAMAVDSSDRIYIAYQTSGSQIVVQRLLENGTGLDTSFNSGGTVTISGTNLSATQIKMAIDLTNSQLVVAVQAGNSTGNVIQLQRYTLSGTAAGTMSTITLTGALLNLTDLFIDSVQNIYVIGYDSVSNHAIVARAKSTSSTVIALDTTYATASTTPGVASVPAGSMTITNAGALDPDRRVYLVGSGSGNGYMSRVFGNTYTTEISSATLQATVGTLDTTLVPNNNGGVDLNTQFGSSTLVGYTAYDVTVNPNGDGTTFFAFGNGTNLIIGKINADMSPVTAFGGNSTGLTTAKAMSTINNMTVDGKGNIIVAGAQSGAQQIYLYNSSGIFQATFENTYKSSVATTVVQQKSGRYIVGGYCTITATAMIQAFKSAQDIISPGLAGTLALDKSFGPNGLNGIYNTGAYGVAIDDLCVDSNDDIYFVYRNYYSGGFGKQVYLGKITANGSGLVNAQNSPTAFNGGAIITTNIGNAISTPRIAINQAGNILIGVENYFGQVYVELYNGSTGAAITSSPPYWVYPLYGTLTKLVGSTTPNNEFYGVVSGGQATVFALTSAGTLDASFNPAPGGTPGYLGVTGLQSINNVYGLAVQLDGKVVMVGSSATPHPIYVRAFGYPYVAENLQGPNIVGAGVLDTTLWPSTGLFALNNTTNATFNTAITGYAVKRIYESGIGLMTFVADSGNNTTIFQLQKDLTVNTGFNTNGYRTLSTNYGGTTGLFVDPVGTNFIVGNKSGVAWAQGVSSTGTSIFAPTSGFMGSVQAVNQQSSESFNRIIFAGLGTTTGSKQPNTNGYLVGFTPAGSPDGTFGSSGNVDMGSAHAITDIGIDYYDNIITVANNSGTVILQKVALDGSTVTDISGFGTPITGAVGNIKMALDAWGNIVVAAATSTGYIVRSYINNNITTANTGKNNAPSAVVITVGTTPVLSNIYTTFDGKIVLVGYDSSNGNAIIVRLISTWDEVAGDGTLTLDTGTFNTSLTGITPQAGVLVTSLTGMNQVLDGIIHYDNRIMLAVANSGIPQPYMARLFGDAYATYVSEVMAGLPGTYDVFFGSQTPKLGYYDLTKLALRRLSSVLLGYEGKAILEVPGGGYYLALTDNATNSLLVKVLVDGSLDTSYNSTGAGGYPAGIAQSAAPIGVNSILMDGAGKILLTGTHSGAGWVQRYTATSSGATSGLIDNTANSGALAFNSTGQVAPGTTASVTVEQTLGRYVVAGFNGSNGTLFGYESLAPYGTPGTVDVTFNSTGTPGSLVTAYTHTIQSLVADQYDRLIFAVLNNAGTAVDIVRLTPTGEYDWTFGSSGVVTNALTTINPSSQIRVAVDANNNIIVTATSSTTNTFSVHAYDNGTGTYNSSNGFAVYVQLDVALLTNSPTITGLVTSADGYTAILGNQTGTQTINGLTEPASMWVARITSDGLLDSFNFNPAGLVTLDGITYSGGVPGIYQATFSAASANVYNAMTVNAAGVLGVLGYEIISSVVTPYLIQVNYNAVTTQVAQSPDAHAVGTVDPTPGAGSDFYGVYTIVPGPATYNGLYGTQAVTNGENFYGTYYSDSTNTQYAKAIGLLDQNNIVVAIDGTSNYPLGTSTYPINNSNSQIYIDMFDNEGIFKINNFGSQGQATACSWYQNQYAQDMIIFTVGGVNKAIVAGYTHDTTMGIYGSLLLQFDVTNSVIDSSFGGFNNNPIGLAVGDGKQAFVVGQQSLGRIIVGGIAQSGHGLLLGYTPSGKLDSSFGNDGYQEYQTGATGIYTHTIDSQNRIVFAYNNSGTLNIARMLADGSALDTSFGDGSGVIASGISITGLQSSVNNNFKVILDGSANIIAVAVTGDGTTSNAITVSSYSVNGATRNHTATFAAGTGFPGSTSSTFVMSKLLADIDSKYIIVAYDSYANNIVMTRLMPALTLDTSFDTTGYLTYVVGTGTQTTSDALIHPDGRIIVVGSNS